MKKWVAVLGGGMFVVLFLSMYMVVDQLSRTPDYKDILQVQSNANVKVPMQELEKDMVNLENSIQVSRTVISRMRNAADKINIARKHPTSITQPEETDILEKTVERAKSLDSIWVAANLSREDGCKFSQTPSGIASDVKMLDVFDEIPFDNIDGGVWKQGWDIAYSPTAFDEEPLQVFVVPHSHNDPGWLKTLDQYYHEQTRRILDNVVDALAVDTKRRFIWAETSYFSMWWADADSHRKELIKKQISSGQLEIVTGGWVMNDEANTHYYAMIDQMIEGNQWILGNLGVKPRAGWAIDPFGHSPTMAYLLKAMGFDAMLIQRVHYSVKKYLAKNKDLMFMWRQNWDHSSSTDILCHMMPFYSYDVPHTCGPDPKICCQFDFRRLPGGGMNCPWRVPPVRITDMNVAERATTLLDQYRKKAQLYKTNVVFIPLGDDFRYDKEFETKEQFTNYQKLFDYINSHPELKAQAQFGTLSEYFDAVSKSKGSKPGEKPPGFSTLSGDFYTYADRADHYWSGYFTTRPFYKNMDRVLESHHRAAEILYSLSAAHSRHHGGTKLGLQSMFGLLIQARRNLGLFQHHDGVTGTAKDHVVIDYATRMLRSIQDMERVMTESAHFLLTSDKSAYSSPEPTDLPFKFGESRSGQDQLAVKEIIIVSSTARDVLFYNSLTEFRKEVVSLHVSDTNVIVLDSSGHEVPSQVNFIWDRDMKVLSTKYELVFLAEIPPLGLATYSVKSSGKTTSETLVELYQQHHDVSSKDGIKVEKKTSQGNDVNLENDFYQAKLDGNTGLLKSVVTKLDKLKTDIVMEFVLYGTKNSGDASGAYLFLPNGDAQPLNVGSPVFAVTRGKIMQEARVQLPNVMHIVRLYNAPGPADRTIDIENRVDIRDHTNKEIAMRIKSNVSNKDREFFTDLNGFQMQRHKTLSKLPLQANFYPMPSMVVIQDSTTRLSMHSAQSLGVSSLKTGWIEIVLDRRLLRDDNRGLGQGVLDNKLTQSRFTMTLERFVAPIEQNHKVPLMYPSLPANKLSQRLNHPIHTILLRESSVTGLHKTFSGLQQALPCDIFLLNLRTMQNHPGTTPMDSAALILHRKGYDCNVITKCMLSPGSLSHGKVTVDNLFSNLKVESLESTSLNLVHTKETLNPNTLLDLRPMELYTYKIKLT